MEDLGKSVYEYPTKHEEGFTSAEITDVAKRLGLDPDKVHDKIGIVTCMVIGGETIIYHCDVATSVRCVAEDRDMTIAEWD